MPFVVTGLLYFTSWVAAGMLQHQARNLAAEAAGLPTYRVEMVDGLNVRLTGFTEEIDRDEAVAAVDRLDSSWQVEGIMVDENESTSRNRSASPLLLRPASTTISTTTERSSGSIGSTPSSPSGPKTDTDLELTRPNPQRDRRLEHEAAAR